MGDPTYVEELSPLDLSMPRTYISVVLIFEQPGPNAKITQVLQNSLGRLSKQVPWLSGKVFPKASSGKSASSLEIRWNANDTPTLVDKGTIAASYKHTSSHGMPADAISSDVLPVPSVIDDALLAEGVPVFATSIFRFADNALGLCISLHHNAVDGTGLSSIMRQLSRNITDPGFTFSGSSQGRTDRFSKALALDLQETSSISSESLFSLHPEYSRNPPSLPEKFAPSTSKLFTISMIWIDALKELMRKYTSKAPTTNTVLSALIWTTITRIRMQDNPSLGGDMSQLVTAVNGRQRIGTNFSEPDSPFFGNAMFYSLSKLPADILAASDQTPVRSLAQICDHIAQSQYAINSRHIAEVYQLIEGVEDCRSLFPGWDLFGSRDLTITSWADLELYDLDFGDAMGKPKFVRVPYLEADGVAIVLPRQRAVPHEVLEVMVMLRRDYMDALERDVMWQTIVSIGRRDGNSN
ncbi:hypothetical protein P170DRAFT_193072 [Aspergillus steynii IBT 23096]|uniref:Transferase family protein n=1 Tax=Aspergillus steynii IBT 23096 TaxID=1392250 RepID=A0A2I2GAF2_9EURO|nr:uncharacterized protein P170DRAFT_193072 [Aspergillus steynii IBT 23096]PLB49852.1 hypothetical protein P170DRAFT_193072 [Aspergillus steynii IBT 23096]